jgi:hypothetical protein
MGAFDRTETHLKKLEETNTVLRGKDVSCWTEVLALPGELVKRLAESFWGLWGYGRGHKARTWVLQENPAC